MIDPKFIINLKGKDYPLWSGILDAATKAGLRMIEVNLIQFPSPENGQLAISQATATFEDGRVFTEIADAGPQNCSGMIAAAAVRMSATRAKGRALRDALNIGMTMFEELGPDSEDAPRTNHAAPTAHPASKRKEEAPQPVCSVCGEPVDDLIAGKALKRWKQIYCLVHGREKSQAEAQAAVNAATGKEEGEV